jgi:hypothetical protein
VQLTGLQVLFANTAMHSLSAGGCVTFALLGHQSNGEPSCQVYACILSLNLRPSNMLPFTAYPALHFGYLAASPAITALSVAECTDARV